MTFIILSTLDNKAIHTHPAWANSSDLIDQTNTLDPVILRLIIPTQLLIKDFVIFLQKVTTINDKTGCNVLPGVLMFFLYIPFI